MMQKVAVYRKEHFNAAHRLHNPAFDDAMNEKVFGKCNNPHYHGHNYELIVKVTGEPDKQTGYVIDVAEPLNYLNFIKDIAAKKIDTSIVKAGAKAFVEENYVVEKNAAKLIEFYKLKKVNY